MTQDAYLLLLTHTKQLLLVTVCNTLAGSGVRFRTDARRTAAEAEAEGQTDMEVKIVI